MDAYATHLEPLIEAALSVDGDILELGCGDYSTPLLSAVARKSGHRLVVNASDATWANRYTGIAEVHIVNWEKWKPEGQYGLVFLDNELHSPGRLAMLPGLSNIAKVVVMHDASQANNLINWDTLPYSRWEMYKKHEPWTITLWK